MKKKKVHDQNLTSSEGGQDISAYNISHYALYSMRSTGNAQKP